MKSPVMLEFLVFVGVFGMLQTRYSPPFLHKDAHPLCIFLKGGALFNESHVGCHYTTIISVVWMMW
jgi:hypothetical protein